MDVDQMIDPKFDNALMSVLQNCEKITNFLDVIFAFLYRRYVLTLFFWSYMWLCYQRLLTILIALRYISGTDTQIMKYDVWLVSCLLIQNWLLSTHGTWTRHSRVSSRSFSKIGIYSKRCLKYWVFYCNLALQWNDSYAICILFYIGYNGYSHILNFSSYVQGWQYISVTNI